MPALVLTLIGPDRAGLVEAVAAVVADHGGNWLESRMSRLAGQFAGILEVEVPEEQVGALKVALQGLGRRGLNVVAEGAGVGSSGKGDRTLSLEVVGQDRPGIVREISQALARRGVNVEELRTGRESAPMSGEALFRAWARLRLAGATDQEELRATLEAIAADLMVDLSLEES